MVMPVDVGGGVTELALGVVTGDGESDDDILRLTPDMNDVDICKIFKTKNICQNLLIQ